MNNTIIKQGNDFKIMQIEYNHKFSMFCDVKSEIIILQEQLSRVDTSDLFATFLLMGKIRSKYFQMAAIQAQPLPKKYPSGKVVIVGGNNYKEIIKGATLRAVRTRGVELDW